MFDRVMDQLKYFFFFLRLHKLAVICFRAAISVRLAIRSVSINVCSGRVGDQALLVVLCLNMNNQLQYYSVLFEIWRHENLLSELLKLKTQKLRATGNAEVANLQKKTQLGHSQVETRCDIQNLC
jgi:hypothetical protein